MTPPYATFVCTILASSANMTFYILETLRKGRSWPARWFLLYKTEKLSNMSSTGHNLLDYLDEDRDQIDINTPSVDNLFSNRDGRTLVVP